MPLHASMADDMLPEPSPFTQSRLPLQPRKLAPALGVRAQLISLMAENAAAYDGAARWLEMYAGRHAKVHPMDGKSYLPAGKLPGLDKLSAYELYKEEQKFYGTGLRCNMDSAPPAAAPPARPSSESSSGSPTPPAASRPP